MIDDPYKILGVSPDASDEQIKAAYRHLAKKYHPDLNPGDETAAKKMQQVNAAYERIKNPQASSQSGYGSSQSGYGSYGSYDPFGGAWQQQWQQKQAAGDPYQKSAYQYILYGRYQEALNTLGSSSTRNARWYYLSALANDGLGNQVTALEHMRKAVSMDPSNTEYLSALSRLENGGSAYRSRTDSYRGFSMGADPCPSMCLCYFVQLFCCGGRCFFCC